MASAESSDECCNRLVFEAVKENFVLKLLSVKRRYSKSQLLTSLIQCDEEGQTPLLIAMVKEDRCMIFELVLVLKNCDHQIEENWQKTLTAINQLSDCIPIMELIDFFTYDFLRDGDWLELLGQVFIHSTSFTRHNRIIALESIGATLMLCSVIGNGLCALKYWREAMILRTQHGEFLPKISPAVCDPSEASTVVYGTAVEVMTLGELDLLQDIYERDHRLWIRNLRFIPSKRLMQIQALLVLRRIVSEAHLDYPHVLYLASLFNFTVRVDAEQRSEIKLIINSLVLILEQMNGYDPELLPSKPRDVFKKTLNEISIYFCRALRNRENLSYANLLAPIKFFGIIAKRFPNNAAFPYYVEAFYRILFVFESISPTMTKEEQQPLAKFFYDYIKNIPERTTHFLHVAVCNDEPSEMFHLGTIKLILKLGADPDSTNKFGETALHIVAGIDEDEFPSMDKYLPVFQTLVNAGSHLDMARDDGQTVLSIVKKNDLISTHPYFESLLNTVLPLSCYAARIIRLNGIQFDEDRIPHSLQTFVARHSAKGKKKDSSFIEIGYKIELLLDLSD